MAYAHNKASKQASKKLQECDSKSLKWNEEKPVIKVKEPLKNQAWPGLEPWPLRWLDTTLYPLS